MYGMKIHRFIGNFRLAEEQYTLKDPDLIHQIRDVLQLKPGERIQLCDGQMHEAMATIESWSDKSIELKVEQPTRNAAEPARRITLYCAILKKENFEWACQKATEAGASRIVPVISERTVKLSLRADRLRVILKEAAEQAGRGIVPELGEIMDFEQALTDARACSVRWFFEPSGAALPAAPDADSITIFVGPEGGWSDRESSQAREAGLRAISLGPRVLRAETAAVIGTYLAAR